MAEEHFSLERDAIFFSRWFCVCREEVVAQAGDYLHVDVAGEELLVVRKGDGDVAAFHNVCRHRGCSLVLTPPRCPSEEIGPSGRFHNVIQCPYHSWTYGLDGELRSARFLQGLSKEDLSLHRVPVRNWGGFVFVALERDDSQGPDRMGEVAARLARYPLEQLRTAARIRYDVAANWKVILENYNECYHCGPVHPELCELVPVFKQGGGEGLDWEQGIPHRPGAWTFTATGTSDRSPFPGLNEEERARHKGELLYPNLMLSLSADHVVAFILWPRDPSHTAIQCDFLFHPDEMEKPAFDPADAIGFWDVVNRQDWQVCEGVQRGMSSRVFTTGYMAPMEDESLDISRYVRDAMEIPPEVEDPSG